MFMADYAVSSAYNNLIGVSFVLYKPWTDLPEIGDGVRQWALGDEISRISRIVIHLQSITEVHLIG